MKRPIPASSDFARDIGLDMIDILLMTELQTPASS